MAERGDDGKRPLTESTEEERKARTRKKEKVRRPVEHGKKEKHRTKGDVTAPGALAPPLRKSKAVRINPEPRVKEFSFSSPPLAEYLCFKSAERFHEWQSHLFHEPTKSAMKPTKRSSVPKVPSKLSLTSQDAPSEPLAIKSPNLAASVVERSKTPSVSSKVSSTLPSLTDPSEPSKASLPLLKHASTALSTSRKDVTSAMSNEPTLAVLPKGTGASTQSSVTLKDSTKLPPILPKFGVANLPALPTPKSKKTGLSKLPTKLPTIEISPEKSPEKSPLRKSPTWPAFRIEPRLPPILPMHSSKGASKGSTATMPPTDYGTVRSKDSGGMVPLISSGELSSRKRDTMQLKVAKEKLQTLRISPEKAKKEVIKPVDIAEGDPEILQECIKAQVDDKYNAVPVVYHELYNLQLLPYSMSLHQRVLPNKSAKVYAILQSGCLKEYKCIKWTGVDISTIFNISDYVPDFTNIKKYNIILVAKHMKLHLVKSVTYPDDFDRAILRPLRVQAMGSIVACKLALDEGWAINIGGGFNHYSVNSTNGGLHMYDDVLICLAVMSKFPQVKKILVVNLDAYQCLQYKFKNMSSKTISCPVDIIDVYTQEIFPCDHLPPCFPRKVDRNKAYHEPPANVSYTELQLKNCSSRYDRFAPRHYDLCISKFFRDMDNLYKGSSFLPSLCIYVAGTYALKEYPYSSMKFIEQEVVMRDEEVFKLVHAVYNIPIAILIGGGYHYSCDVEVAAASISNLCQIGIPLLRQLKSKRKAEIQEASLVLPTS